jgi:LPXTG-motif cell wall-anchored protein
VVQYTVEEVLPTGYTDEYGIKIDFSQATYVAGTSSYTIVNPYMEDQEIATGTDLGFVVIRHGNDFVVWTPRPLQDGELETIKTTVKNASNQFNKIVDPGRIVTCVSGLPKTVDVGNKHAVSVYMKNNGVWVKFLAPNAESDLVYGKIPYTYTQAGGEGGGTITNTKKHTDIEFGKQWIDISQQEIEWDQDIQVTVSRNKGDGTKDDAFSLVYNIAKTSVNGATGGTAEFSTGTETDPKLKLTITTESGTKKYSFKIENLAYSSETDGKYTYYVEETNSQLTGYLAPSYTNTSAPTGATAAYDGGTIINKQEGGYELPSTGGPGTTALYLFGFTLTGLAGTGLVTRKKQRETA